MNYHLFRAILFAAALFTIPSVTAQDISLINSGEVINEGKALYDSGKFKLAALKLLTVPKRDTNYVYMLSELALAYHADSLYDKAIEVCNEALLKPSSFKSHLLRTKAIATDKKGNFDESVKIFNDAISKYPFDYTLIFNLGITYYNHKDYSKAEQCFFKVLSINPFHASSHLNLGNLAIGRARRTHSILAMGAYLSLRNGDNSRLVLMNRFLGNELKEDNALTTENINACEKLDQIIRSGIAMDKKFDSKIPVSAAVVKQFEIFFNQLSLIQPSSEDNYARFYLPIYKAIKEKGMEEQFIYNILTSSSNEDVKKWIKKNDKTLTEFYNFANVEFKKPQQFVQAASYGYQEPVQGWYNNSTHQMEALGKKRDDGRREGMWYYFHNNYELSGEGKFGTNGEKTGTWKYYYSDGKLKSIENSESGEITFYYPEGGINDHYFLKNDKIEGEVEIFYSCGVLKEKLIYKDGKRDGKGQTYFIDGKKRSDYIYKEGDLEGEFINYHPNGKIQFKKQFAKGLATGLYQEFHSNSKLMITGEFVNDKPNGLWQHYYYNGKPEKSGNYKEGIVFGEWLFYNPDGSISESRNFSETGKWQGESITYYKGKKYIIYTYNKDILVKVVFVDQSGKELGKFEGNNGDFLSKTFFATGAQAGAGRYKKGKQDGAWIYYYPDGIKRKECQFENGLIQGEMTEYFKTGRKKIISHYKDDELDGYYQEFYLNGKLKQHGWFKQGQREQQWLTYFVDGTLESDYFYLNGEFAGPISDYNVLGKLSSVSTYLNGKVENIEDYNSQGLNLTTTKEEGAKKTYEVKYSSGKTKSMYEIVCGVYHGHLSQWFPNGAIFYDYDWVNGWKSGELRYMTTDNTLEWGGERVNGYETGKWTYKNPIGLLDSEGIFFRGEYDSTWNYYYQFGAISSTAEYSNGDRDGITHYFAPDGTSMFQKLFESDRFVAYRLAGSGQFGNWIPVKKDMSITINYTLSGKPFYEEVLKNGEINGSKKIYYPDGKLYSEYNFIDGDYEGKYFIYHANGKVAESGEYKNDKLMGTRQFFNQDGLLLKSEEYVNGMRHGKSTTYLNGAIKNEVIFWGGTPDN